LTVCPFNNNLTSVVRPTKSKPTTHPDALSKDASGDNNNDSEAGGSGDDYEPLTSKDPQDPTPSKAKKRATAKTSTAPQKPAPSKKRGVPAASDHANYRKLKIKNQNTKANRGRFGRRR
jgi:hypothetical protein